MRKLRPECSNGVTPGINDQIYSPSPLISFLKVASPLSSCCCSVAKSFPTLWPHGLQHTRLPCPPVSLGLAQTHAHWVSEVGHSTISSCCPLLLLPSSFPRIRLFSDEPVLCIRWSKYWSFRFSISPSNEYSGLISCRIEWLDLLAVQGTVTSLLQQHSLIA